MAVCVCMCVLKMLVAVVVLKRVLSGVVGQDADDVFLSRWRDETGPGPTTSLYPAPQSRSPELSRMMSS